MPKMTADFTAILEEAFRAEVSAAFMPKLVAALLIIAVLSLAAWRLFRFLKKRQVILPKHISIIFVLIFSGVGIIQIFVIRNAHTTRSAALAEIPGKAKHASALVQRLLADSTGTAVTTESGTYLALAGEQVFLPKPVADALQKTLVAQNLRLP